MSGIRIRTGWYATSRTIVQIARPGAEAANIVFMDGKLVALSSKFSPRTFNDFGSFPNSPNPDASALAETVISDGLSSELESRLEIGGRCHCRVSLTWRSACRVPCILPC